LSFCSPPFVCLLACFLSSLILQAQQPSPATPAPSPMATGKLRVIVLEGEGAINSISLRTTVPPVVEIRDENERPVEGAEVIFRLPAAGPGGTFPGQQLTRKTRTNGQGQAAATGFAPNTETGRFRIHVTATSGNLMGETSITQTNVEGVPTAADTGKRRSGWWKWAALAAAGGGGTGLYFGLRGNGNSTVAPPAPAVITVTPGPISFGPR
jgi:hypothetical protein